MRRWVPSREELLRSRWLAPLAHRLDDDRLWHFERGNVALAVAIGVFLGLLLPVGQFILAVALAVWLRAHVAIAAAATLVSNPLTFPPIYWLAYRIGRAVLGKPPDDARAAEIEAGAEIITASQGWLEGTWFAIQAAGPPLFAGLAILAVLGSVLGYTLAWLFWRPRRKP